MSIGKRLVDHITDHAILGVDPSGVDEAAVREFSVLRTTTNIVMSVDDATGIIPPSGTLVTNQTEYDALGGPLKRAQYALDILPNGIGPYVIVNLEDGEHPGVEGNVGNDGTYLETAWLAINKSFYTVDSSIVANTVPSGNMNDAFLQNGRIYFVGRNNTELEPEQAGTTSGLDYFVRSTGSDWVTNEFQGKLMDVTSGFYTGYKIPICSNTSTTLEVPAEYFSASGLAMRFTIVEPKAIGIAAFASGEYQWYGIEVARGKAGLNADIEFRNIQFGKDGLGFAESNTGTGNGALEFKNCIGYLAADTNFFMSYGQVVSNPIKLYECCFVPSSEGAGANVIHTDDSCYLYSRGCFIKANSGGGASAAIKLIGGGIADISKLTIYDTTGNNSKYGISIAGSYLKLGSYNFRAVTSGTGVALQLGCFEGGLAQIHMFNHFKCTDAYAVISNVGAFCQVGGSGTFLNCSGNTFGARISSGGFLALNAPSGMGGTTNCNVDAVDYTWAGDFANAGSTVEGSAGSELKRLT
jgi:hypothetical protein